MPQPQTCRPPRPWSPALSHCPPRTARRATIRLASLAATSGPGPVKVRLRRRWRPACARKSGRVSRFAPWWPHGTSPYSRPADERAQHTRAFPGTACPASSMNSRTVRSTTRSLPICPVPAGESWRRTSRPGAWGFTTRWAPRPDCSLPNVTRRPAAGNLGSERRSPRWRGLANGTDRNMPGLKGHNGSFAPR